jgi:hypothetical protein
LGLITTEEDERLWVESSGFLPRQDPGRRCGGRRVTFERHDGCDDVRAVNVSFPSDLAARRARMRSGRGGRAL